MKFYLFENGAFHDASLGEPVEIVNLTRSKYDYPVFCLAVVSAYREQKALVTFEPLTSLSGQTLDGAMTCFNAGLKGYDGIGKDTPIQLVKDQAKPLYFGIDLSKASFDLYKGAIVIGRHKVKLLVKVTDDPVFNYGTENPQGLARLQWLNSDIGRDESVLKGFEPVAADKSALFLTGKKVAIGRDALIDNVQSFFNPSNIIVKEKQKELFFRPSSFEIKGYKFKFYKQKISGDGRTGALYAEGKTNGVKLEIGANVRYEGVFDYKVKVSAEKDIILDDIALNLFFSCCTYNGGLGKTGGLFSDVVYDWKAEPAAMYAGDVNCGARVLLKPSSEFYSGKPWDTWQNFGLGTVQIAKCDEGAVFTASTGKMIMPAGTEKMFCFEIALTPFKAIDYISHFSNKRTLPVGKKSLAERLEALKEKGVNTVILSSGTTENATGTYPLLSDKALKEAVSVIHSNNMKAFVEFSSGSFPTAAAEYLPFLQIGNIVNGGAVKNGSADTLPRSSYENFYLEQLSFLSKRYNPDGVISHGAVLSAAGAERAKRIAERQGISRGLEICKEGALQKYFDVLPFYDYICLPPANCKPDYMLIEMSSIPFGLTAAVCGGGCPPCLGMLYGINSVYGEGGELQDRIAESLYTLWDSFSIKDSRFYGYWDKKNPVSSDKKDIYISTFINKANLLAVIYNASGSSVEFDLGINARLGYTSKGKKIMQPAVLGLHWQKKINFNKPFRLKAHKGMILTVIEKKKK